MAGVYAVNSYLLVICSAGCLRVFPFFCHFFADFRLFSVLLRVRVFSRVLCVFRVYAKKILHFLHLQNLQLHFTAMQNCAKSAFAFYGYAKSAIA